MPIVTVPDFITVTLGLVTFLIGALITRHAPVLQRWDIPEPVTGGLLVAFLLAIVHVLGIAEIGFTMDTRDRLLVIFFAAIGLNARIADLVRGGRLLGLLLLLTVILLVVQNLIGTLGALAFGLPAPAGVLLGSAALMGGHGTVIAWGPVVAARGVTDAAELGVAAATLGLVAAGLIGGPIARLLIDRHDLKPARPEETDTVGLTYADEADEPITASGLMRTLLAVNICVILGYALHAEISALGVTLPLFVPCLIAGIGLGNLLPLVAPGLPPIRRTAPLALVSDYALGVFLAISLMSLKLWALAGLGTPLLAVLAVQAAIAIAFVVLVLFPMLGGDYRAAVLGAGFGGFALGATPTAIANMTAVTKRHGPCPTAFVILPLVSAFFVDIANTAVIQAFLLLGG